MLDTSGPLVCRQPSHLVVGPACHVGVRSLQVQQTDVPGEIRRGGPIKRKILGTNADGTLSLQTIKQYVDESLLLGSTHRSGTKFFSLRRQPLRRRSGPSHSSSSWAAIVSRTATAATATATNAPCRKPSLSSPDRRKMRRSSSAD